MFWKRVPIGDSAPLVLLPERSEMGEFRLGFDLWRLAVGLCRAGTG